MVHCRERGDEMIVGDLSHLHIYEQGGSAQVSEAPASSIGSALTLQQLSVYLCVDTAGRCPRHHGDHARQRDVRLGAAGVKDTTRLP